MAATRGWPIQRDAALNGSLPKPTRIGALLGLLGFRSSSVPTGVMVDGSMDPICSGTGTTSPNPTYSVRACQIVSKYSDANGPTIFGIDSDTVVPTIAAPGSNSRRDLIWARQNLVTADGGSGTVNTAELGVENGIAGASPATPATPAGAVALGYFTVPAGATSTAALTYTPLHNWLAAAGGVVPAAKGSREFKVWNGTTELSLFASEAMTKYAINLANFNADELFISRRATTGTGGEMTLYGRLTRGGAGFTLSGSWTDLPNAVSVPANMRPDSADVNVYAVGLHNGHTHISLRLNTSTGVVSIRSQFATITINVGDFFSFGGATWTRGF